MQISRGLSFILFDLLHFISLKIMILIINKKTLLEILYIYFYVVSMYSLNARANKGILHTIKRRDISEKALAVEFKLDRRIFEC